VLESVGLKVAPVDGWQARGRSDAGVVLGVICHHTAGSRTGNMGSLGVLIDGRADLPGPLAQLGLGRDGTYYVIAAGRCNHAGQGSWQGLTQGNTNFIGIEAENTGKPDDPWPAVQVDAYHRGVAAILKHVGRSPDFCCGHREYAMPAGRKSDPSLDMGEFRRAVAGILSGAAPAPRPIPASESAGRKRATLRRGDTGPLVEELQKKLGFDAERADGDFGPKTEAAVREFQRGCSLVPDGIVGPKTWTALDAGATR
jgi:hypothetical protein